MRILSSLSIILMLLIFQFSAVAQTSSSKIFTLIKQKKYDLALKMSNSIQQKIVLSHKYLDPKERNNFAAMIKFLEQNPKWPQANLIRIQAENSINDSTDNKVIFNYFKKNEPVTSNGYKYYAIAASSLANKPENLQEIVKKGWYKGNSTKTYYDKFKSYLSEQDHIKKIDKT